MDEITIDSFAEINPGIGNRLKLFLDLIQKTPVEIAEEIDMPVFSILDIQAEKTPPNIPLVNLLYKRYELDIGWLLTGKGKIFMKGDYIFDLGRVGCLSSLHQLLGKGGVETGGFVDISDIELQYNAKRALEIAAAGYHHLLIAGPAGCGKTMLLKALPTIMTGDTIPASGGLLFADELEYRDEKFLQSLKPLLDDEKWLLAAAMSDCDDEIKAGDRDGGKSNRLMRLNTVSQVESHYYPILSRGLLDRFDIKVKLDKIHPDIIIDSMKKRRRARANAKAKGSAAVKKKVAAARKIQRKRFKNQEQDPRVFANAQMDNRQVLEFFFPDQEGEDYLHAAAERFDLTARGIFKVMKLSRTIADLEACPSVHQGHVEEAVQFYTFLFKGGR